MQASVPHPSSPLPLARSSRGDGTPDDLRSPVHSKGMVVDFGLIARQPLPDWDWGPDDERRGQ